MDTLLFKVGEIPEGGIDIEIPGSGSFPEWRVQAEKLEVHSVVGGIAWQKDLLSVIDEPELSFPGGFEGVITLFNRRDNVIVAGRIMSIVKRACSRCTELFDQKLDITFKSVFTHGRASGRDIELKTDDLELNFFHGDMFDVGQVICEQISLNLPVKPLCNDDCLGLCVKCGRNLNAGICTCKDETGDIRFEKLKNMQIK